MNENDSHAEGLGNNESSDPSKRVVTWGDGRTPDPEKICTARRSNGDPCRKQRVTGAVVCATHGGRAPQVKEKARVRLDMAADKLVKQLLHIAIDDPDIPSQVKLAAIRDALSRVGITERRALELEVGPSKGFEQVLTAVIGGGSRAESRSRRGVTDDEANDPDGWMDDEILDAQIVDNEDGYSPAPALAPVAPQPTTPWPSQAAPPANGSGLLPFEEALDRLHNTPPLAQQPAPRRRTGH